MLSNKQWDFAKWFAIAGMPAIGVAYAQLADVWGLPYAQAIPKTIDIIGVLLAAFLAWENYDYNRRKDAELKNNNSALDEVKE